MASRQTITERFWAKVDKRGPDECWPWVASCDQEGYGRFNGPIKLSHRASWSFYHGAIPSGICVLHSCDNPPCCNPLHLFLGTNDDNVADRVRKGRGRHGEGPRGEAHPRSKLTDGKVLEIRLLSGNLSPEKIARRFSVSRALIWQVIRRKKWKHVA